MKASRLMSIVFLLQAHGRMTTQQLAERCEVSTRTILRDVESLSAAGVPVYTERGRHGAVVLDSRARLDLNRLDPAELQLLTAVGVDTRRLAQIGLGEVGARAQEKIDAAAHRRPQDGPPLDDVLLIDPSGWFAGAPDLDLSALVSATRDRRRVRLSYRGSGQQSTRRYAVDPYGLACKQASWYLVGDVDGEPRMFNAARIRAYEVQDASANLRDGETLASVWSQLLASFASTATVEITAELRATRLDIATRILGTRLVAANDPVDGWLRITVAYPEVESVRQLLQFGDHIRVVDPPEAVTRVHDLARAMVRAHDPDDPTEDSAQA